MHREIEEKHILKDYMIFSYYIKDKIRNITEDLLAARLYMTNEDFIEEADKLLLEDLPRQLEEAKSRQVGVIDELEQLRRELGMNIKEFCESVGLNYNTYNKYRARKRDANAISKEKLNNIRLTAKSLLNAK